MRRFRIVVIAIIAAAAGSLFLPGQASATPYPETWLPDSGLHTYCFTAGFSSSIDPGTGTYAMSILDSTTDMTISNLGACSANTTDVWWWSLDLVAAGVARGLELDYDKLASPAAAVAASELIVRGTLVGVTDGISYSAKGGQAGRSAPYVTLAIQVDSALKGTAAAGSTVYAQLNAASSADAAQLAKSAQNLKVVAVLDDISGWAPAKGVTVVRPKGVAAGDPLYLAFPDGLWLQGTADKAMVGVHAEPAEMSAAWGTPQTLDQYWATLEKAAK